MLYYTRRFGSQRKSKPVRIKFEQNFAGQGGADYICFKELRSPTVGGTLYHFLVPESEEDLKELQRQAAILPHNFTP